MIYSVKMITETREYMRIARESARDMRRGMRRAPGTLMFKRWAEEEDPRKRKPRGSIQVLQGKLGDYGAMEAKDRH